MERERRELCIEGVAIDGGPESCAGVGEGVGEALGRGVRVGWAMEPRHQRFGVPTPYNWAEGNIVGRVSRVVGGRCAVSGTCACAESPCARTGRPGGCLSASMMLRPVGSRGGVSALGRAVRGRRLAGSPRCAFLAVDWQAFAPAVSAKAAAPSAW
jgi:hypothetical protein